jgi:hypothetical protein
MNRGPLRKRMIVCQKSVSGGTMPRLQNEADRHAVRTVAGHGKSHGVEVTVLRKSQATRRVSQIAQLPQLILGWLGALLTGGPAFASPPCAQRQPRGVKPAAIFEATFRHEKGAGHVSSERRLFYRREGCARYWRTKFMVRVILRSRRHTPTAAGQAHIGRAPGHGFGGGTSMA